MSKNKMSKNKIVTVKYYDIVTELTVKRSKVDRTCVKDLFEKCELYGKIIKEDNDGIVVMHCDSNDEIDYTAIPIGLIRSVK